MKHQQYYCSFPSRPEYVYALRSILCTLYAYTTLTKFIHQRYIILLYYSAKINKKNINVKKL